MPSTRSSSGLAPIPKETATVTRQKRKAASNSPSKSPEKKVRVTAEPPVTIPPNTANLVPNGTDTSPLVPAVLSFDFEEAKQHLINADARFEEVFDKMACKPFEQLEQMHPFKALATSILGQQISWMAARSINHKFIRLYDQSIPEHHSDYSGSFFPSPQQVAATDLATLRTAGLSGRKAEYIRDLAQRFTDGRITTEKLLQATDEELSEMLIAIYGVGKWTVDMFSIFSMRRPNILPVADLGVQRGVVRWFLSLHSNDHKIALSPEKLRCPEEKPEVTPASTSKGKGKGKGRKTKATQDEDVLPAFGDVAPEGSAKDVSSVAPGPASDSPVKVSTSDGEETTVDAAETGLAMMPPPFTPSINKTLNTIKGGSKPTPLPAGITAAMLKSRMDPKKKIKGAMLTPKEMEDLTEPWKPYRSLAVYYMWALQEEK